MKFLDLIRTITDEGAVLVRHGHDHDWYRNAVTGRMTAVPRHREVNENTARKIVRILAAPGGDESNSGT